MLTSTDTGMHMQNMYTSILVSVRVYKLLNATTVEFHHQLIWSVKDLYTICKITYKYTAVSP